MKKSILLFTILLSILSSCKKDDVKEHSESCYTNNNPQSIVHDGINREYVLYVPNSYDSASPVPVLFNFHGFGAMQANS